MPRQNPISQGLSDEARPPGIAKKGATTDSVIAVSSGEDGPSWSRANGSYTSRQAVGEAWPPGFAKHSATTGLAVAESFGEGEAGSSSSGTTGTTSAAAITATKSVAEVRPPRIAKFWTAAEAVDPTGEKSVGEARPPKFAMHSATTKPKLAESFGEAGPSWPRANGVDSAAAAAAIKSAGKARPPGIPKQCATTEPKLAESSGGAEPSWSIASGLNCAAGTAAVKSAGEARPSRVVKCSVTSECESELGESFDEESSPCERGQLWTAQQRVEFIREFETEPGDSSLSLSLQDCVKEGRRK